MTEYAYFILYSNHLSILTQPGIRTNTTVCLSKIASYLNAKVSYNINCHLYYNYFIVTCFYFLQTRQKILISAFARSLKDPFPPARIAGITGLASTNQYYTPGDVANKILPTLCPMTIDKEKSVREQVQSLMKLLIIIIRPLDNSCILLLLFSQALKVMKMFINALERHSETMPDSTAEQDQTGEC